MRGVFEIKVCFFNKKKEKNIFGFLKIKKLSILHIYLGIFYNIPNIIISHISCVVRSLNIFIESRVFII